MFKKIKTLYIILITCINTTISKTMYLQSLPPGRLASAPRGKQDSWTCASPSCETVSNKSMKHCCFLQTLHGFDGTQEGKQNEAFVTLYKKEICYCSNRCQKEHWAAHKGECVNVKTIRRDQTKKADSFKVVMGAVEAAT